MRSRRLAPSSSTFVTRSWEGKGALRAPTSRNGDVVARPAREDGIMSVPGGLVHHWVGSTFISGVTLNDALEVSSRYDDYPSVYKPIVVSTSLSHDENTYRVLMRIKAAAGGFSASSTSRRESNPTAAASTASRTRRRYGSCAMPESPTNKDSCPVTIAASVARGGVHAHGRARWWRVRRDGDDWTVAGFSHAFELDHRAGCPPLGRSSVERSLQEFSMAVRTRSQA